MSTRVGLDRVGMAREVALDLADGSVVNLGIGLPQAVAGLIPAGREVILHAEHGVLGLGRHASDGEVDLDLIDAGKKPVTLVPGAAIMGHPESFAIVRGGHLDACVLGAYQVSASGDLANWSTGTAMSPAVGGAMDLAVGARSVLVVMRHCTADGRAKIVSSCSLPLTAPRVVDRIYTDLGIFEPRGDHVLATALAVPIEQVRRATPEIHVEVAPTCVTLPRPDADSDG